MYVSLRVEQGADEQTQSPGAEEHHFLSHLSSLAARLFLRPGKQVFLGRSRRPQHCGPKEYSKIRRTYNWQAVASATLLNSMRRYVKQRPRIALTLTRVFLGKILRAIYYINSIC